MILAFSTQINKKPTYFVERIHLSFRIHEVNMKAGLDPSIHYPKDYNFIAKSQVAAKIHSIREDKNKRWKAGTKIDFFINCRQKYMFRFAPVLPVVSVQKIEIRWIGLTKPSGEMRPWVQVDGKSIYTIDQIDSEAMTELALNDGFDSLEKFFEYFNQNFEGVIVHWTDKKY